MPFDPSIYDPSLDDEQPSNAFTVLRLSAIGVPPYSARGVKQTIAPIGQATQLKRDVNGELHDISFSGFRKYSINLSCEDQEPPAVDGVWPGLEVVIDWVVDLAYRTGATPGRDIVEGSQRVSGNYTLYRPRSAARIVSFNVNKDEYGAMINWTMDLEEK
jgi:hypothetical protein